MAKPVSDADANVLKNLGGGELVITIIFTITVGLLIVIIVKRQILRMMLLSKRGPHSTVGSDAPSTLAREIDGQLKRISKLRIEPRLVSEQSNKTSEGANYFDSPPDHHTRGYKYRMKAIDKMSELDDLLCAIDQRYSRPKGQSVRDHLKALQNPPYSIIRGGDDNIAQAADLYEHARFGHKEYGSLQYRKFAYLVEQLKDRVRLYTQVPGSLIVAGNSKKPIRRPPSSTKIDPSDVELKNSKVTMEGEVVEDVASGSRVATVTESGAVII